MFTISHHKIKAVGKYLCILINLVLLPSEVFSEEDRAVKQVDTVEIHYTGKLEDGKIFDKSEGRGPLKFQVGSPGIIKGMRDGVLGMKVGENKTLKILPKEAYGEWTEKMTTTVSLKNLPAGIKPGEKLTNPQGHMVMVKEINGDSALLDGNHFLAGKTLIFDIKLVSIN
tara:strand:+ start:1256 stop:1765 length:510 start_codon:yes stop_codon:yes gene_type:complete